MWNWPSLDPRVMMRSTALNKLAITWLALWFGVIVPGHTRGRVLVPGDNPPPPRQAQAGEACPLAKMGGRPGTCCPLSNTPPSKSPTAPAGRCAICYLTGVLDVPGPIDLTAPPLELVEILPWPKPAVIYAAQPPHAYFGRAPPIAPA